MQWLNQLRKPKFWLLGLASTSAALHLTLVDRANNPELFTTSLLFWLVAGSLIWDKRHTLQLESSFPASLLGLLLLTWVLLRTASLPDSDSLLRAIPFVSVLGTGLFASGAKHLKQYWKELLLFAVLAIHPLLHLILRLLNLAQLTAKAATFMLWYTGFDVQRQGLFLVLPQGRVEVYEACSGIQSVLQMVSIAVLFLLLFPLRSRLQSILCLTAAILIGFIVNALRVALMAILVSLSQNQLFEYWHTGNGSLLFSVISVSLFGLFCWLAFIRNANAPLEAGTQTDG